MFMLSSFVSSSIMVTMLGHFLILCCNCDGRLSHGILQAASGTCGLISNTGTGAVVPYVLAFSEGILCDMGGFW